MSSKEEMFFRGYLEGIKGKMEKKKGFPHPLDEKDVYDVKEWKYSKSHACGFDYFYFEGGSGEPFLTYHFTKGRKKSISWLIDIRRLESEVKETDSLKQAEGLSKEHIHSYIEQYASSKKKDLTFLLALVSSQELKKIPDMFMNNIPIILIDGTKQEIVYSDPRLKREYVDMFRPGYRTSPEAADAIMTYIREEDKLVRTEYAVAEISRIKKLPRKEVVAAFKTMEKRNFLWGKYVASGEGVDNDSYQLFVYEYQAEKERRFIETIQKAVGMDLAERELDKHMKKVTGERQNILSEKNKIERKLADMRERRERVFVDVDEGRLQLYDALLDVTETEKKRVDEDIQALARVIKKMDEKKKKKGR
ncbi:MAG: hypothetical protein KAT70_06800, partial [Thermoplasmata archaeon]|nr:hypothetical protein [Thermoplasmata archaeon]